MVDTWWRANPPSTCWHGKTTGAETRAQHQKEEQPSEIAPPVWDWLVEGNQLSLSLTCVPTELKPIWNSDTDTKLCISLQWNALTKLLFNHNNHAWRRSFSQIFVQRQSRTGVLLSSRHPNTASVQCNSRGVSTLKRGPWVLFQDQLYPLSILTKTS